MIWMAMLLLGADESFVARTLSGKEVRGPLAVLAADGSVELGKGVRRKVAGAELATLRRAGEKLPELPADEHLVLLCGDRVPVRDLRLEDEKLLFKHPDLGAASVPLAAVALIWRAAPDRAANPEAARRRMLAGKRTTDRVVLRNGDSIEGSLSALGAAVEVEQGGKKRSMAWVQVAAVSLSADAGEKGKPKGAVARIVAAPGDRSPGGRFTVVSMGLEDGEFIGKTTFGATLRVPLDRLLSLERLAPALVPLSSLPPSSYRYFPYLDESARWSADGTEAGGDLRVGGSVWGAGISVRAHSRTEWALGGAYRRFEALAGLDDREGRRGKARLRLLADGRELSMADLSHGAGPVRVQASVEGVKVLTLEVLHAGAGPVRAVVDLVDARLAK